MADHSPDQTWKGRLETELKVLNQHRKHLQALHGQYQIKSPIAGTLFIHEKTFASTPLQKGDIVALVVADAQSAEFENYLPDLNIEGADFRRAKWPSQESIERHIQGIAAEQPEVVE